MSEKRKTPIQILIEKLEQLSNNASNQAESFKQNKMLSSAMGSECMAATYMIVKEEAQKLLPLERKEIEDAYNKGVRRVDFAPEKYFNENFNQ